MSPNAALDSVSVNAPSHEPSVRAHEARQVAEHMPLVHRIVARFARRLPRSVQRDDLTAAGTLGLLQALRTSQHTCAPSADADCSPMFVSYACIRIRGAIVDELRRHDWSPRRRKADKESEPARARDLARAQTTAPANDHGSGTGPAGGVVSLRPPPGPSMPPGAPAAPTVLGFDDLPPAVALALGDESPSALEELMDHRAAAAIRAAVDELPAREKDIIAMRYFEEMPSKTIAQVLGLSEARISQLHARATARLRDLLAADAPEMSRAA